MCDLEKNIPLLLSTLQDCPEYACGLRALHPFCVCLGTSIVTSTYLYQDRQ